MAYNPSLYAPYQHGNGWYYQQNAQPVNGLVSVTGIDGAKAYQLPPNSSMPLFDANDDVLYVKTTDAAGYPTVKTFRFEPAEEPDPVQAQAVTQEQFDELAERVNALALSIANHKKVQDDQ